MPFINILKLKKVVATIETAVFIFFKASTMYSYSYQVYVF